jgi:hypothetical protein
VPDHSPFEVEIAISNIPTELIETGGETSLRSINSVLVFGIMKNILNISRRKWVDNIQMDLGEIRWGGVVWIDVAQDRDRWRALVNTVMNPRLP